MSQIEFERKFLVCSMDWKQSATGTVCRQGYISREEQATVRVRIMGNQGFLTLKSSRQEYGCAEFEYAIPVEDCEYMLEHLVSTPIIEKVRHSVSYAGLRWDIDEFLGANSGLVIAEVELESPEQSVMLPPWVGDEVTGDSRYYNSSLSLTPYSLW